MIYPFLTHFNHQSKKMKNLLVTILACSAVSIAGAQEKKEAQKGNPSLASSKEELAKLAASEKGTYKYSVADYFKKPAQFSFQFSPDGKYLSYKERDANGKSHVFIKNTITNEVKKVIEEKDELIRGYGWAGNTHLVYMQDKGGDENFHIYTTDLDGSNKKDLTPYAGVKASITKLLKEQPDYMIVENEQRKPAGF